MVPALVVPWVPVVVAAAVVVAPVVLPVLAVAVVPVVTFPVLAMLPPVSLGSALGAQAANRIPSTDTVKIFMVPPS